MIRLGHPASPPSFDATPSLATLSPAVLTRHAVCLGATGSGKTGLCLSLLEDLALAGTPILALDPKGDLANLALVFPELAPADFLPWLDATDAARSGTDLHATAAAQAATWKDGLARAGLGPVDLQAFRDRVDVVVMTPGSDAGVPVDVLTSLTRAPAGLASDPEGLREYVTGAVGALLGLVGEPSDPPTDPASILLARLLTDAFAAGRDLPFDQLLPSIVDPPFEKLGDFPLDEFLPRRHRLELALKLDAVLASPAFAAWREGEPLDVGAWLAPRGPDGRTPLRVLYLAPGPNGRRRAAAVLRHAAAARGGRVVAPPAGHRLAAGAALRRRGLRRPPAPPEGPAEQGPAAHAAPAGPLGGPRGSTPPQNPGATETTRRCRTPAPGSSGACRRGRTRARVVDGLLQSASGTHDEDELEDVVGALPGRTFVVGEAGGDTRVVRSRQTLALLRAGGRGRPLARPRDAARRPVPGRRAHRRGPAPARAPRHPPPPLRGRGVDRRAHRDPGSPSRSTVPTRPPVRCPCPPTRW